MKNYRSRFFVLLCIVVIAKSVACAGVIDRQKAQADPDPNSSTLWYDCKDLLIEGKGWTDTQSFYDRLPAKAEKLVREPVWGLSHNSAGICARFNTDAKSIQVRWTVTSENLAMGHMPATGVSGIDLYAKEKDGKWWFKPSHKNRIKATTNTATFDLPGDEEYMLYLPLYNGVKSIEIGIDKENTISKPDLVKCQKPIVFYGTSITQGGCASRPGMATPAIVGRRLGIPIINLGFSGSARMEPEVADLLAELDPEIYVIDALWNMNQGDDADKAKRADTLVRKLRAAHPTTPIVLVEDSSYRNITPTPKGLVLRAAYEELVRQGVENLYFLPNESMLGEDGEGTVDGCHFTDLGMMRQAEVFIKILTPILQKRDAI